MSHDARRSSQKRIELATGHPGQVQGCTPRPAHTCLCARYPRELGDGWHRIADVDRAARTPAKTVRLLAAVHATGPAIGALCDHLYQHGGAVAVRRILGVLALAKKHGPAVVENAAATAVELGVFTYRFLRRYLERQPPLQLTLRQVDPLIRQLTLYRDLIEHCTGPTALTGDPS